MDGFGSFNTTFGIKPSNVGGARFDFQQGINASLAQWSWGIIPLNMHGDAPIKVMLHIYFNFEYVNSFIIKLVDHMMGFFVQCIIS